MWGSGLAPKSGFLHLHPITAHDPGKSLPVLPASQLMGFELLEHLRGDTVLLQRLLDGHLFSCAK